MVKLLRSGIFDPPPYPRRLKRDLSALWPLDEASGNRRDVSGNANTLTDNFTVTQADGPSIYIPKAAQFTRANTEYLTVADNTFVSMGAGVRMSMSAFVYADSLPAGDMSIMGRWDAIALQNQRSCALYWTNTTNRFVFIVSPDGTNTSEISVSAATFGAVSATTWYLVACGYDGARIYISVNNGPADSVAYSADLFDASHAFAIGALVNNASSTAYWDGRIAQPTLHKRVVTAQENTWRYNNRQGRSLAQLRF